MEEPEEEKPHLSQDVAPKNNEEEININFILETLATFANFHVTKLNERWIVDHYSDWQKKRSRGEKICPVGIQGGRRGLSYKAFSASSIIRFGHHPTPMAWWINFNIQGNGPIQVWNPGCGTGVETYSLADGPQNKVPKIGKSRSLPMITISYPYPMPPTWSLPDPAGYPEWADYVVKARNGFGLKPNSKTSSSLSSTIFPT
jgi:hypothetical protein